MTPEAVKKLSTRKLQDWEITALIYKVANPLQGIAEPTTEEQKIIDRISKLRVKGKLNEQQIKILDGMQWYRISDSDEF